VFLHDLTRVGQPGYDLADRRIAAQLPTALVQSERLLHVFNKADAVELQAQPPGLVLSARTGAGLAGLRAALLQCAGWQALPDGLFIARARHVHALQRCAAHLALAQELAARGGAALDLLAEELRLAHDALGEITGVLTADALLGEIFSRFCIGK
jgi:tRNA modification GTPase